MSRKNNTRNKRVDIPMLTTSMVDETKYEPIGLVTGLSIRALSFLRQFLGSVSTIFGGRQDWTGMEEKLAQAREEAIEDMLKKAHKMGAHEIIGVSVEMSEIAAGHRDAFLVVSASGTAVKLKKKGGAKTKGGKPVRK